MTTITLSMPEALKKRIEARRDVNWNAVVARIIEERLKALELVDRLVSKPRLTQKDVGEIADLVDTALAKRLGLTR